jgi:hypothetical protein
VPRLFAAEGFRLRFLLVEPLVGPVDLARWIERIDHCKACGAENPPQGPDRCPECGESGTLISTWGEAQAERFRTRGRYTTKEGARDVAGTTPRIDWVIVGGESGPKARPCNVEWIRDVVRQCREAGVPCFVKQLGSLPAKSIEPTGAFRTHPETGKRQLEMAVSMLDLEDKQGGDPSEWPEDIRVREFPEVVHA